jgi:hypothetical protein
MQPAPFIAALEANGPAIAALARAMPAEQVRWRPEAGSWSALEVVNHLADEEREDFRTRLDTVLNLPGETPPAIDPEGWVVARGYNERDFDESLTRFLDERRRSLAWLGSLTAPDWSRAWAHPSGDFSIRAGDLLVAWAAHDLLHLRQLVEIQYHRRAIDAAPYGVEYAGEW